MLDQRIPAIGAAMPDCVVLRVSGVAPASSIQAVGATAAMARGLEWLQRLGQEAEQDIARLSVSVDVVAGAGLRARPIGEDVPPLIRARRQASDMVDRLIAFLDMTAGDADLEEDDPAGGDINDGGEDDDDGEPSLAVPETPHYGDQDKAWNAACRSPLRNEDLEPNLGLPEMRQEWSPLADGPASAAMDEIESDLDTLEADDLDKMECAYEDLGEADEAESERDPFPYGPPRRPASSQADPRDAADDALRDLMDRKGLDRPAREEHGLLREAAPGLWVPRPMRIPRRVTAAEFAEWCKRRDGGRCHGA